MKSLPTVAIVGQTNVGKSSLFNRLYGAQEAVVAREAGTTRDSVVRKLTLSSDNLQRRASGRSATSFRGTKSEVQRAKANETVPVKERGREGRQNDDTRTFWLVDTAGLKAAEDDFEASIQEQIDEAADAADVIMVVVDSTLYPSDQDRLVAKKALRSKKPVILVVNKVDLKGNLPTDEFKRLGIKNIIRTSAEHNEGLNNLREELIHLLPPASDVPTDDVLRIALVGRPNVGKSYLFNTLAGKQQAIVANVAGTTRDVNKVSIRYHGREVELLDTAGIRRSGKQEVGIEKFSVLRTLQAIDQADICLLLMDANELNTQLDQKLAGIVKEAGKGLVLVVSKWDSVEGKDAYTRDALAPQIARQFVFVPWAPLIFTSSVTGQNVTKILDLAADIDQRRKQKFKTTELNKVLQRCLRKHPPAGLKNTYPKLRYMVQTDTSPPWFVIFGGNLKLLHWSYKRYLERQMRETFDLSGTPIMFSFRQEDKDKKKS